jgi:hypothetical protein
VRDLTPEEEALLLEESLLIADHCRDDACAFLEYALVEERTRARIVVSHHQRVLVDFVLAHRRAVVMMPAGSSKTWTTGGLALWLLGRDNTMRGAIISSTQGQAAKPLKMVRDNLEESEGKPWNEKIRWVFPNLKRSRNAQDAWTQTAIVVDRPYGIRDASLRAVGYNGDLPGARLNFIMVDDLLSQENTATIEQRAKVYDWFVTTVRSRLDLQGGRVIVLNTAWHPGDAVHQLIVDGWPTLVMRIDGQIELKNTDWDHEGLRPDPRFGADATGTANVLRLAGNDPDPHYVKSIWPQAFTPDVVDRLRAESKNPQAFNRMYMNLCRDDASSMCKQEYIDACLRAARAIGCYGFVDGYQGNRTFTGVDLAIGLGTEHDDTAFFTFEARPDGLNVILDLEVGKWAGPEVVEKIADKAARYNSVVCVESNAGQDYIRQWALEKNRSLMVKPHNTGREKAHPEDGIPGIFVEMSNGAWAFPNGPTGTTGRAMKRLMDACLYYAPTRHADDVLMAMFLARAQARAWGMMGRVGAGAPRPEGSLGMSILAR